MKTVSNFTVRHDTPYGYAILYGICAVSCRAGSDKTVGLRKYPFENNPDMPQPSHLPSEAFLHDFL
jgi:hypothetical protein